MIRAETLKEFSSLLAPSGFRETSFLACYGMAECSLAVSFAELSGGDCYVELVSQKRLPRTSSGKLSRSTARRNFIEANDLNRLANVMSRGVPRQSIA